ncbi:esterase/lipase family protein [Rhodococcus sp. NPDC058521]|uniref:esterase/lipase family protein n=1 Tax=Rhodococcus sp. NPDC058521 TaxID=3346536 RepID=UPI0036473498
MPPPPDSTVGVGLPSNNFPDAFAEGLLAPNAAPVGANDWNCKPDEAHPQPVVLVHGTGENSYNNWSGVSPILKDEGYRVIALNYGKVTRRARTLISGPFSRRGQA